MDRYDRLVARIEALGAVVRKQVSGSNKVAQHLSEGRVVLFRDLDSGVVDLAAVCGAADPAQIPLGGSRLPLYECRPTAVVDRFGEWPPRRLAASVLPALPAPPGTRLLQ